MLRTPLRRPQSRATTVLAAVTALLSPLLAFLAAPLPAATAQPASAGTVVAPYVDMGAPELYREALKAATAGGLTEVTAGFVTSRGGCTPRWDDGRQLASDDQAAGFLTTLHDKHISTPVSFGGAGSNELAQTCHSVSKLTAAYEHAADAADTTHLDFDIEGRVLLAKAANLRRWQAIAALLAARPAVSISVTVPVNTDGLPHSVRRLLREGKAADVPLPVVNLMTMDYGPRREMGTAAVKASKAALLQVRQVWSDAGWSSLGMTPEIGRNDSRREVFTIADAHRVRRFADSHALGQLAFWAVERDRQCAGHPTRARYDCSGVSQSVGQFGRVFTG